MNESRSLLNSYVIQIEQLFSGGNWLEESFRGKLSALSEHEAFAVPVAGIHTVAEIVWHCIYWRTVNIRRFQGDNQYRDDTIAEYNFLPLAELKKKGWPALQRELEESQEALIALLRQKDDAFLALEYQPGLSHEHLVAGTIQHDCYHLGQIGLVLKMQKIQRQ